MPIYGATGRTTPLVVHIPSEKQVASHRVDLRAFESEFEVDLGDADYVIAAPGNGDIEYRDHGFLRTFTIPGSSSTSFVTMHEGIASGMIYAPEGAYMLRADGHEATVSRSMRLPLDCDAKSISALQVKAEAVAPSPARRRAVWTGNMPATIRLLEVYSTDALAGAGSAQAMEAEIQAAVDQLNLIAKDSGAGIAQFALAKAQLVNYTAVSGKDLTWVSFDSGVAALRKQYQADLVVLWTEHGQDIAWVPVSDGDFEPSMGFSVVGRDVAIQGLTHAHEIGHNLGMEHNAENVTVAAGSNYPYARGYKDSKAQCQTVMGSYFDPNGLFYSRIPRFSNPDLFYSDKFTPSFRTGSDMANNARMLREKAAVVAQYHLRL
jgi:hypothetical protein